MRSQEVGTALEILDEFLEEAGQENRGEWVRTVSTHAALLAEAAGDLRRARQYYELRLPYVRDRAIALYNLAQLSLREGQVDLAKAYASKAYELSVAQDTESAGELVEAIIKQWPDIGNKQP